MKEELEQKWYAMVFRRDTSEIVADGWFDAKSKAEAAVKARSLADRARIEKSNIRGMDHVYEPLCRYPLRYYHCGIVDGDAAATIKAWGHTPSEAIECYNRALMDKLPWRLDKRQEYSVFCEDIETGKRIERTHTFPFYPWSKGDPKTREMTLQSVADRVLAWVLFDAAKARLYKQIDRRKSE